MSTAVEPKPAGSPQYLEFDQYVEFQLQKTRAGIRAADLLTAVVVSALAVLGYLFVFTLLDHWVIPGGFGYWTRVSLLTLLLGGLTAFIGWKVVLPARRRVAALYAARELEKSQPELRSNLLTLVDLQRAGRPVAPQIISTLQKRAARSLAESDVDEAIDRQPLLWASYALCGLMAVMFVYVVLSPKKMSASLWRALWPAADVAAATRTRIEQVRPGDATVLRGDQLEVQVDLSGEIPAEIRLLFTTDDARYVDEPVALRAVDDRLHRFRGVLTGERGRGLLQGLTYHIAAGDAESRLYRVTVVQPPSATVGEVGYRFPDYMRLGPRTDLGGTIDAWEGTLVTVRAVANMPVAAATIQYSDDEAFTAKAEEFPLSIRDGTKLEGTVQLRFRPDGTTPQFYRVQVRTAENAVDPRPVPHPLRIRPDLPPKLALHHPSGDQKVPANAVVPLAYRARDPDFLLHSVALFYRKPGDEHARQFPLVEAPLDEQSVEATFRLPLPTLSLAVQPGDRIAYWLEARDNLEPFPGRRLNVTRTDVQHFEIIDPAAPQQVEQQFTEGSRAAQERLDETRAAESDGSDTAPAAGAEPEPPPAGEDATPAEGDPAEPPPADAPGDRQSPPRSPAGETGTDGAPSDRGGDESPANADQPPPNDGRDTPPPMGENSTGDAPSGDQPSGTPGSGGNSPSQAGERPANGNNSQSGSAPQNGNGQSAAGESQSAAPGRESSPQRGSGTSPTQPQERGPSSPQSPGGDSRDNAQGPAAGDRPTPPGTQEPSGTHPQPGARDASNGNPDRASDDRILREVVERFRKEQPETAGESGDSGRSPNSDPGSGGATPRPDPSDPASPSDSNTATSPPGDAPADSANDPRGSGSERSDTPQSRPDDAPPAGDQPPRDAASPQNTGDAPRPSPANSGPQRDPRSNTGTPGASADRPESTGTPQTSDARGAERPGAGSESASPSPQSPMNPDRGSGNPSPMDRTGTQPAPSGTGEAPRSTDPQAAPNGPGEPSGAKPANPDAPRPSTTADPNAAPPSGTPDAASPAARDQGTNPPGDPASPANMERPASADRPGDASSNGAGAASPNGTASDSGAAGTGNQQPGNQQTGSGPTGRQPGSGQPAGAAAPGGAPSNATPSSSAPGANSPTGSESPASGGPQSGSPPAGSPMGDAPAGQNPANGGAPPGGQPAGGASGDSPPAGGAPSNGAPPPGASDAPGAPPAGGQPPAGDNAGQPGGGQPGGQQPAGGQPAGGQPGGGQPGSGQPGGGQPGGGQPGGGQPGGGQPGGGQPGAGQGSGEHGSGGAAGNPGGASGGGSGGNTPGVGAAQPGGGGGAAPSNLNEPSERNLDDERRAANLALQRLQDQLERGEVDADLKQQLGVDDAELQEFLQRMQDRLSDASQNETPEARARRRQFEEMLRGIEYDATGGTRAAGDQPREAARGSGGVRRPTPPEYREQERAFREAQTRPAAPRPSEPRP